MRGKLISFEGIDSSGKSTQVKRLTTRLEKAGKSVLTFREPGDTTVSEKIRDLVLHTDVAITPMAELLLYEASRAQLVTEKIIPALEAGRVVIVDRFFDSTTAYQGYGRGIDLDLIRHANELAVGSLKPHLTFFIDLAWDEACRRRGAREEDRIEKENHTFFDRVRQGYLVLAKQESRFRIIDGMKTPDAIEFEIWKEIEGIL